MKYLFLFLVILTPAVLFTQTKPEFLPEDLFTPGGIRAHCYCKPGLRHQSRSKGFEFEYGVLEGGTFNPEDETALNQPWSKFKRLRKLELDLKAPIVNNSAFKLIAGYKFTGRFYDFERIGVDFSETFRSLDDRQLKSNNFQLIVSKPLDEKRYVSFRVRYSTNGNYGGWLKFDPKYAIYKAMGVYAVKPNDDVEWGIGVNFSQSFRRTNIVPLVLFNKNFSHKWGIESVLPAYINLRHNIDDTNILLFGFEYDSQSYRLEHKDAAGNTLDYALNQSEVKTSLELEHQFAPWIWSNVELGYQMNFSSDFESKSDTTPAFRVDPSSGVFFSVGLFLSPPDDFGK
jgi:hypothetical protein